MDERKEYYEYLENLRKSGITNMWGGVPFLVDEFGLSYDEAKAILQDWIKNYDNLSKEYGWKDEVEEVTGDEITDDRLALFDEDIPAENAEEILANFDDEPEYLEDAEHIYLIADAPLVIKYKDGKVKFFQIDDGDVYEYRDLYDWSDTFGYDYDGVKERVSKKVDLDSEEIEDDGEEYIDNDEVIDDVEETDESLEESPNHRYEDENMISLGQVGVAKEGNNYIIFKDTRDLKDAKDSLSGLTKTDIKYIIQACTELLNKESK